MYAMKKDNKPGSGGWLIGFGCLVDVRDRIRRNFLQLAQIDEIIERGVDVYFSLCRKYYPNLTEKQILEDPFMSPLVKGIAKIKLLYNQKQYVEAKQYYNKLCFFCNDMPWDIKFRYEDFYLWYFLIKWGFWSVFDKIMKIYLFVK